MDYVYYNVNPLSLEEQDCVIRAISLATSTPYEEVISLLEETKDTFQCEALCMCCYSYLLDNYFKFDKIKVSGMTSKEVAKIHPYGIYLIRMDGHLSCMINGCVYDIWDCSNEIITDCWKVDS